MGDSPELEISNLDPKQIISGNRRLHHMQRAKTAAYWRGLAYLLALQQYGHTEPGQTWHQRAGSSSPSGSPTYAAATSPTSTPSSPSPLSTAWSTPMSCPMTTTTTSSAPTSAATTPAAHT